MCCPKSICAPITVEFKLKVFVTFFVYKKYNFNLKKASKIIVMEVPPSSLRSLNKIMMKSELNFNKTKISS